MFATACLITTGRGANIATTSALLDQGKSASRLASIVTRQLTKITVLSDEKYVHLDKCNIFIERVRMCEPDCKSYNYPQLHQKLQM